MNAHDSHRDRRVPHVLRLVLCLGLAFGIFTMHEMLSGTTTASDTSHHVAAVKTVAHDMGDASATEVQMGSGTDPDQGGNDLTGCCGIVMLCMAMLAGLGALLVIRARGNHRILWQLPPPTAIGKSLRIPQFHSLTPIQRSSVLRC